METGQKLSYIEAVGRRKNAVARVRLTIAKTKTIIVNGKEFHVYFPTPELRRTAEAAIQHANTSEKWKVSVKVLGGGMNGQAEAVRHGITRALVKHNEELRKKLKKLGFLKRDPREKERRKFGLKKARKAPQWSKR